MVRADTTAIILEGAVFKPNASADQTTHGIGQR